MATMFGRFEIQSELSRSDTALVYKATDTETNQIVALKTQSLEPLGERAPAFVETLIAEGERTRDLASQNIALLYGAGEIDGQFCAAMEYIQGNSIATMLARKEGFSIWDLVDITRQVCAGLDYAAAQGVVHYSLEPAKIMVQWDGLVKMLGYGISNMSLIEAEAGHGLGRLWPYCSPEQVRGEAIDVRSNLFTWGAILYEMVAGRRAFDAQDPAVLVNQIQNEMPSSPSSLNPKIQPGVSALIMKALAKDPEARYQTARELVEDLEKCKDSGKKSASDPKQAAPPKSAVHVNPAARAAAAGKFVGASSAPMAPAPPAPVATPEPEVQVFSQAPTPVAEKKSRAAAAGMASAASVGYSSGSDSGARLIEEPEPSPAHGRSGSGAQLSATAIEPESEAAPRIAVDPVMAGLAESAPGASFSDIAELPPLKEAAYVPPPPPVDEAPEPAVAQTYSKKEEKPKIQPREVAEKAFQEIKTVPPRLILYSIFGAVGLILIVVLALFFHVRNEDDGSTAAPRPTKAAASQEQPAPPAPVAPARPAEVVLAPEPAPEPEVTVRQFEKRAAKRASRPAPVPVAIPGQVQIDSNPQGAQIQLDGKSDPAWVTPFNLTGLSPGKHIISASKTGYSAEIRSVDVASASKSFVVIHLSPNNALLIVNSTPSGAAIVIDGKNTGHVTPTQFTVDKGPHTVLLRKPGYLEETTTADLGPGQNFQFAPVLRALGNADDIRTVGKFKKLFGKGGDSTAGMGALSIRTQPKGAQIAVNQRLLEKTSPVEVMLGPGNYVLDITLTGFKPIHRIVNVDKGGKVAVDEILERE